MAINYKNRGFIFALITMVAFSAVFAMGDATLESVPADCVLCVRMNNFDYTLSQVDQFLAGASPMGPMGPSMLVRMQLANLLGDPTLQSLDTGGSFVFFILPIDSPNDTPEVLGALMLPVKNYSQFVSANPNVGEPDESGISEIKISPMGAPGTTDSSKILLSVKARKFAMVTWKADREKLLKAAKSISFDSIAKHIDADQAKLAAEMPVWAYADIEKTKDKFGPTIQKFFAQAKEELKGMSSSSGPAVPANIAGIMQVYFDMINAFLEQGKYASITLKPEPVVLRIQKILAAKLDTDMAQLLTSDATLPKENKLISQLGDGAAVNVAAKIDKASMKKLSKLGLKFMNACSTDPNAAKKMDEWNQIIEESVDSVGQILSCSVRGNTMGKPPFIVEYILEVKDKQKYDKMVDKSAEMMTSGSWSKMYKDMGMDMSFDVQRGVGEYKGIPIDNAKLSMKMTDTNSPKGQMIQMMYGDGFDYRYAYADGLYLTTLGGDPDGTVKKMIDSVKAGFNKQPGSEMTAAITLLGGAKDADFVGTINYIRLIGMITNFVPAPMPIPFDKIPTKSNIAFAGKGDNGKLVVDVAVPKEHIMEFVTGMQMLMQPPQGGTGTIQ